MSQFDDDEDAMYARQRRNDRMLCSVEEIEPYQFPTHWRMGDGNLIAVKDATDSHLKNMLAKCQREHRGNDLCVSIRRELVKRKIEPFLTESKKTYGGKS